MLVWNKNALAFLVVKHKYELAETITFLVNYRAADSFVAAKTSPQVRKKSSAAIKR